jgi:hypothetical protein
MRGVRHFLRNFTAMSVKEHLRSQIEDTGGSPKLTDKEIDLVRYIRERSVDWEPSWPGALATSERGRYAEMASR